MSQISYGTITITDVTDIDNIQNYYLATSASSGVTTLTSGWTTAVQSMDSTKQYLWNYEQILGTGGVVINTTTPVIIGRYGQNGQNGQPGVSITSIDEYYKANNSSTSAPASWNAVNVIDKPTASNKYLWNYQVIHYSNNTSEGSAAEARIIGVYGDKGDKGDDGISPTVSKTGNTVTITDAAGNTVTVSDGTDGTSYYTHIRYATSSTGANMTATPTSSTTYIGVYSGTSSTAPTTANSYTWSKYMGTDGISVTKVTPIYYLKTSSGSAPTAPSAGTAITSTSTGTGVWTTAIPTYVNGGTYYTSTQTYLSGGTSPVSSTAVIDQALTTANSNAYGAYNIATDINQHFWSITEDYATGIPAGSYMTEVLSNTFKSQKTGGNLLTRSDGIWIRNGVQTLASLTGTALQFYNPSDNNHPLQLSIGANGTLQSGNFVYTSGTYADSGTKIDLTNGSIYTPGFRTDGSNTYIRGEINALSGQIGNNGSNYWTIGNNYNYDQTASAALISHGTAFIQLDTSNTWRLSTDRIHTAWNGTDSSAALMFPKDGNTYWDWGIHSPHQTDGVWKDKFVYARKYTNTTDDDFTNRDNLTNDIDDNLGFWKYQFYIDKNGSIYARNFYLLNEDGTPGSNIGGQDAVYLLKTGGTITGNLEVNGTLTKSSKNVTYLTAPPTSGQILIADGTSGGIKTSGYTIAKSVPSNALFTDENVKSTEANTTKLWLVGSDTSGTRTGALKYDSGVYITTTAGTLHATTFEGALSGTASRATADEDGNTIKTTYLKLSGGNVTGAVTFGSSVSADELTVGDLVVNGAASFTNNLQANTINGVTVGSSPKFTDVNVTQTATTTNATYEILFSYTADNTTRTESARKTSTFTYNPNTKELTVGSIKIKEATTGFTISGGSSTSKTLTVGGTYSLAAASTKGVDTSINAGSTSSNLPTSEAVASFVEGKNYVTSSGVTGVTAGDGLTGGGSTPIVTISANLRSTTKLTRDSTAATETTDRIYPVVLDKTGYLAVNVPWTNVNSSYLTSTSTLNWNKVTQNRPTTLSGYGITDASIASGVITLGSDTISKMPNPNALTIKVYNANTATAQGSTYSPTEVSYDGSASGKTALVAGTNAITNISASEASGGSSTFTVVKADGSSSTFNVNISGAVVSGATILTNSSGVGLDVDGPVYFDDGTPKSMKPSTSTGLFLKDDGTWATPSVAGSATNATYATYDASEASNTTKTTIANKYIPKSIGTAAGDIIYWSGNGTPVRLAKGNDGQFLKLANGVPSWGSDNNTWRTIQVNETDILGSGTGTGKLNLKAGSNVTITNDSGTVTIASSYTNTDTKVTQAYSTTNNSYPLLMTATAGVSSTSSRGDTTAILNNAIYANPSTGMITTFGLTAKKVNNFITGSGTAASDKGSGVSPRYFPAKWTFNIGSTLTDGDIITIKVPVAGHDYGVFMSIDNGTNYYPVVVGNGTSRLTTHFGNSTPITVIFDSNGSAASVYALNGADARATVSGGVWRVLNYYDTNTYPQAYCSTGAGTAAKTASMSDYVATANRYIMVEIVNANTSAGKITLNINNTGAKPIYINGAISSASNYTLPAGSYLVFYDGTNYYFRTDNIITGNITGNAATATKLASAQTVYVALGTASTTTTIQGGSSSAQTIGVNGTLAIGNGGTGLTASPSMLTNLGSTTAANVLQASPRPGITGTLGAANGGTGQTSLINAANSLLNALSTGSSTPVDNDYYISQYVGGGTTTTTYHRRPMSALWSYISGKISSSGTYVTIGTDQTITANQKTFNGAIRWSVTDSTTGSKYGACNYNATLDALVFSFGTI